jgi:hypothetical protein
MVIFPDVSGLAEAYKASQHYASLMTVFKSDAAAQKNVRNITSTQPSCILTGTDAYDVFTGDSRCEKEWFPYAF